MKRKFLEDLGLEKDVIDKIMSENGADITKAKGDLESVVAERDKYKNDLSEYEKQLESLKKATGNAKELQDKITELQESNKKVKAEYEESIKSMKIDGAISLALKGSNAKYEDLISGKFDRSKITVADDGKIIGIDEQLKDIKKNYKDLFEPELKGKEPDGKGSSPEAKDPFIEGFNSII